MSIIKAHVTASSCDLTPCDRTPFWEVLHDQVESQGNSDRMAGRPENFTKAGFFFGIVPHVWGRLAYIRRAKAPVTRQDTNGEGGRRLEPVGSAFMASSLVRSICDGMAPTRMYKRGCDLHGNGFACSEIHQRGFYTLNYVGQ